MPRGVLLDADHPSIRVNSACRFTGGTGTGKPRLAVSIARACIREGQRGRLLNVVDLVNKLDAEARAERQGRAADLISRLDFLILDELGCLLFVQTGGQLLLHLIQRPCWPAAAPLCEGYAAPGQLSAKGGQF